MYSVFLFLHSWLRWIVLLALLFYFFRCFVFSIWKKPWTQFDQNFSVALGQVFGIQVFLGLIIWITVSPFPRAAWRNPDLLFVDPLFSFWTLYHGGAMLLGIFSFEIGKKIAANGNEERRFAIFAATLFMVLLILLLAIPWPWLEYGRPWFRSFG